MLLYLIYIIWGQLNSYWSNLNENLHKHDSRQI